MAPDNLRPALGGMCGIPQWFVWRLEWSPDDEKWLKAPCYAHGGPERMDAGLPKNWTTYDAAMQTMQRLRAANSEPSLDYTIGFRLTEDCGYWFYDLDKCIDVAAGTMSPVAVAAFAMFPNAAWEYSHSGKGLHFFGRGEVPEHAKRNKDKGTEFYTDKRGIAFGNKLQAGGNADTDCTGAVQQLVEHDFPPRTMTLGYIGNRNPAWRGPENDELLIERMLRSGNVLQRMGVGETVRFVDLWTNNTEVLHQHFWDDLENKPKQSEIDMSLAVRLAWWTGNDAERMLRLMLRSQLVRDKWYTHATFLDLTIEEAINRNGVACYAEPEKKLDAARAAAYGTPPPPPPLMPTGATAPAMVPLEQAGIRNHPAKFGPPPPPPPMLPNHTVGQGTGTVPSDMGNPITSVPPPPPPMRPSALTITAGAVIDGATGELVTDTVYNMPADTGTTRVQVISPEMAELRERLIDRVRQCGTVAEMHNDVIPAIQEAGLSEAFVSGFVRLVNDQLKLLGDAPMQTAKLRDLLAPPRVRLVPNAPGWLANYVWCHDAQAFFNLNSGMALDKTNFNAEFNRNMPVKDDGITREDAARFALDVWCLPTVDSVAYRPDEGALFDYEGRSCANTYSPVTIPECAGIAEAKPAIDAFCMHLAALCNRRASVYEQLLSWMAYNVQNPGRKIRWAPLIKGIQGDGKSMIGNVLAAAMGRKNVGVTGNETLCNSGGFTDWATGCAVNVIEEIMLTGKERHKISNMLKQYISNDHVSINAKGAKGYGTKNTTNHMAVTNFNDAVPLELPERRWFVIFSPFHDKQAQALANGFDSPDGTQGMFEMVFNSLRDHPGQWRTWLLTTAIPESFRPNGDAPDTPEKRQMAGNGADDVELWARALIRDGSYGVHPQIVCSALFFRRLEQIAVAENFPLPKTNGRQYLMTRLGFSRGNRVRWEGGNHWTWVRQDCPLDGASILALLDSTREKGGKSDEDVTF